MLEESSPIAILDDLYCKDEKPLLLDPLKPRDCSLISFDRNGEVFPTYSEEESSFNSKKASISIEYYGLKQTPLKRGRMKIWQKCDTIVNIASNDLKKYIHEEDKRESTYDNCYLDLAQLYTITEPFTCVVKSFVKIKSKEKNYEWFSDAIYVLQ